MESIYVSIAACKEPYLFQTIDSAIRAAANPGRVFFGIFNTVIDDSDILPENPYPENPNVMIVQLKSDAPMGTGYSRMNAMAIAHREHDYVLQIDAHMIFDKNWDEELISAYVALKAMHGDQILISNAPPTWTMIKNKSNQDVPAVNGDSNFIVDPLNFNSSIYRSEPNGNKRVFWNEPPGIHGNHLADSKPVITAKRILEEEYLGSDFKYAEVYAIHASYLFGSFSDLAVELIHDPRNIWDGDQLSYTLRVISRGYRIFSIPKPSILGLTKLNKNGDPNHDRDWRATKLQWFYDSGDMFQGDIFTGRYFGYWGAPNIESLELAKNLMGVSSYYRTIEARL